MKNWSTDTKKLEKDPEAFAIWRLEQTVNFGLSDKKIDQTLLKKYFDLITIDPARKNFLSFLLSS